MIRKIVALALLAFATALPALGEEAADVDKFIADIKAKITKKEVFTVNEFKPGNTDELGKEIAGKEFAAIDCYPSGKGKSQGGGWDTVMIQSSDPAKYNWKFSDNGTEYSVTVIINGRGEKARTIPSKDGPKDIFELHHTKKVAIIGTIDRAFVQNGTIIRIYLKDWKAVVQN